MNRESKIKALVKVYGAIDVVKYCISNIKSDIASMRKGVEENNPLQISAPLDSLEDNIRDLNILLKDAPDTINKQVAKDLK